MNGGVLGGCGGGDCECSCICEVRDKRSAGLRCAVAMSSYVALSEEARAAYMPDSELKAAILNTATSVDGYKVKLTPDTLRPDVLLPDKRVRLAMVHRYAARDRVALPRAVRTHMERVGVYISVYAQPVPRLTRRNSTGGPSA
jgi:hypothetical protein